MRMFGVDADDFEWRVAGVNHLNLAARHDHQGKNGLQMVHDFVADGTPGPGSASARRLARAVRRSLEAQARVVQRLWRAARGGRSAPGRVLSRTS